MESASLTGSSAAETFLRFVALSFVNFFSLRRSAEAHSAFSPDFLFPFSGSYCPPKTPSIDPDALSRSAIRVELSFDRILPGLGLESPPRPRLCCAYNPLPTIAVEIACPKVQGGAWYC